jgi:hypothetical protein
MAIHAPRADLREDMTARTEARAFGGAPFQILIGGYDDESLSSRLGRGARDDGLPPRLGTAWRHDDAHAHAHAE